MSVHAYAWAWKQRVDPGDKFVLVALCDFADPEGVCWPSMALVARMTGKHRSTVHRSIERLCDAGLLVVRSGRERGRSNTYQLQMTPPVLPPEGAPEYPQPDAPGATGGVAPRDTPGVAPRDRGVAPGATGGVAPGATRTVIEPSEPPAPPAVDNTPPDRRIPDEQRRLGLARLEQLRQQRESRML